MEKEELAVVMPVYNEEAIIGQVIQKWSSHLLTLGIDYQIHVYNDGSKDNTEKVLNTLQDNRLIIHNKSNSGHGPTILQGYRENSGKSWLFQIDSDDELDIQEFATLWGHRNDYDLLIGYRTGRKSHISRKLITMISWLTVRLFYGKGIKDTNCPYRLMRVDSLLVDLLHQIPTNTRTPNLMLSGYFCLKKKRIFQIPVSFKPRNTGEVSLVKMKLLYFSLDAFLQVIRFRFSIR
ncbi:MAG: glycosyltransferase family 2 protein [Bacteroidales bacterium]